MKKDLTEMVFILDRSGSMSGLEKDTIGGFNSMINSQKSIPGNCVLTTVLFDHDFDLLHDRMNIKGVAELTTDDYFVRGSTALFDAIGKTIVKIEKAHKHTIKDELPEKVVFVITTDGEENSSVEFSNKQIKRMINQAQEKGWEFIFLGANIDAVKAADSIGISHDRAASYVPDNEGTSLNYMVIGEAITDIRVNSKLSSSWKKDIDEDYKSRSGNKR